MPTTPRTGLRYPDTTDSPNGPLQIGNLAADLDDRVFPSPRPYIDCLLRRSDGSNNINPSTGANPTYGAGFTDLKVYPVSGAISGTWDTAYSGRGLSNDTPGWWSVEGFLSVAYAGARYISLTAYGTETRLLGVDTSSINFGAAKGSTLIRADAGLTLLFEAYNSVNSIIPLRTSTGSGDSGTPLSLVRVTYMGPL